MIARLRRRLGAALDRRFWSVSRRVEAHGDALGQRLDALHREVAELRRAVDEEMRPALRALAADEPGNRRRVHAARAAPDYEAAFAEDEPLVSVTVATTGRAELTERSLPSILAQTYRNLEVVVVGDAVGPEVGDAVAALGDERVRFATTTHRVVHPAPQRHWLTGSTMARNEANRLARGRWLLMFDDDDALRPHAVERLLAHARAERLEVVYSPVEQHLRGDVRRVLGGFPPRYGHFNWIGALLHAGLRGFEREHVATAYGVAGDWWLMERLLRAGARVGQLDEVLADSWPSTERYD